MAGKPVDIGSMNERVLFQKNCSVVDRFGNHMNTWEDHFACSAHVDTWQRQGDESGDEVKKGVSQVAFICRYCPELSGVTSTDYRILFQGRPYDILYVDPMNYGRSTIRFKAEWKGA